MDPREPILQTEYRTIILCPFGADTRQWTFPVHINPPIKTGRTKVFPPRATLGPTDPDVDDTLTTVNFMDISGGMGVYTINPASDLGNYWWGVAECEGTDGWTAAREAVRAVKPSDAHTGPFVPLGRIGASVYGLWGDSIHKWSPDDLTWGPRLQTIGAVVNTEGLAYFNEKMYFPLGDTGYSYVGETAPGVLGTVVQVAGLANPAGVPDGATVSPPRVFAFVVHLDLLWALTTKAQGHALVASMDGTANSWGWAQVFDTARTPGTYIKLETSFEPKTLAVFPNAQNQESLWVAGRRGLKVYDSTTMRFRETALNNVPPHPDFGRCCQVFRTGEALWIAGGGGDLIQYTVGGAVVPAAGPGGQREGMPGGKRGGVVSMATDLFHLYCLVQGETELGYSGTIVEETESGDPLEVPGAIAISSVIANTGKGWHPKWETAQRGGIPTKIVVADSTKLNNKIDYRVFWGVDDQCWSMMCRLSTHSARQAIEAVTRERFRSTDNEPGYRESYIEWGRFNAGSIASHKLASHVAIMMEHATNTEYVEYEYYTDHDHGTNPTTGTGFKRLGRVTRDGGHDPHGDPRTVLPFGLLDRNGIPVEDPEMGVFAQGLGFHWIRQRLRIVSSNAEAPPIVTALTLAYLPVPQDAATKAYTIPLPVDLDPLTRQTAEQITNKLESLLSPALGEEKFLFLQDRQQIFRAYISSISYGRVPTADGPGSLTLTLIQIPTGVPGLIGED
jgi:hypothetical protein